MKSAQKAACANLSIEYSTLHIDRGVSSTVEYLELEENEMSEDSDGDEDSAAEEIMETVFGELSEFFQLNTSSDSEA